MSLIDATYPQTYFVKVSISSRIFENVPQKGLEYSHRNLAIARFLVTVVRIWNSCSLPFSSFSLPSLFIYKQTAWIPLLFVAIKNVSCGHKIFLLGNSWKLTVNKNLNATTMVTPFLARFPAKKNAGCANASQDFPPRKYNILLPRRAATRFPSLSPKECTVVRWRHNQNFSNG